MRYTIGSLCLAALFFTSPIVLGQNGAYSSYYSYTVTYNSDGSATVTPTAEINGIDDVSDWVEGSYRPVCNVAPKIQLTSDPVWVRGTRVALGRQVSQVRTGVGVNIPASGSTVGLDFAVEADVTCSGAPNPINYMYPSLANLNTWDQIDPSIWSLVGFEPAQTDPTNWTQYCPSGDVCSVGAGVASVRNFVDFADFLDWKISIRNTVYGPPPTTYLGACYYTLLACSTGKPTCTQSTPGMTWVPSCPQYMEGNYLVVNGACSFGIGIPASGPGPCD